MDLKPLKPLSIFENLGVRLISLIIRLRVKILRLLSTKNRPSYKKSYATRPGLTHRFFLPPSLLTPQKTRKYPLFLEIHGGGFVTGAACEDDNYCALIARNCNAIVVSLSYHLAPQQQYPHLTNDCIASVQAILNDPDLPIDDENIVIGGMSAGGNLALSLAQSPALKGLFKAMVIWYPIVSFTLSLQERLDSRPKDARRDIIAPAWGYVERAYVPVDADLRDPHLSPLFSATQNFPDKAMFVAAEDDILALDTRLMADKLAEGFKKVEGEEGEAEGVSSWAAGGVRWVLGRHMLHAFNQNTERGAAEVRRREVVELVHERITGWLSNEVFGVEGIAEGASG